jgi:hypothetical protein
MNKKKFKKVLALFLAINLFFDTVFPTAAMALTTGPSQPEVQSFTPIGTSDMVNLFTGDFSYNVPLLDIEGYPVNLGYSSGVSTDQEASWVGLGWNINPGTINRNMRALPDDFDGDQVKKEINMKANQTFGLTFSPGIELFGKDIKFNHGNSSLGGRLNFGIEYNTYNGLGISVGASASFGPADKNKSGFTGSLGLTSGTEKGLGISPSVGYSKHIAKTRRGNRITSGTSGASLGLPFNTIGGLQALTLSTSTSKNVKTIHKDNTSTSKGSGGSNSLAYSFASPAYTPEINHSMINVGLAVDFTFGAEGEGSHPKVQLGGHYSGQFLENKSKTYSAHGYMNTPSSASTQDRDDILLDFNREKDKSFTLHTPDLPLTNFTYDVFSVSGQGIGGTYRPFRNDVGILHDAVVKNFPQINGSVGIELGAGEVAHVGVNVGITETNDKSSKWVNDNQVNGTFAFGNGGADYTYEQVYFKQAGEKTAESDMNYFNNLISGYDPIRLDLQVAGASAIAMNTYKVGPDGSVEASKPISGGNVKSPRSKRNEVIVPLTANVAQNFGLSKDIKSYSKNNFAMFQPGYTTGGINPLQRVSSTDGRAGNHLSEITAYRADGAKYVYGIPAYNFIQKEASFAVQRFDHLNNVLQTPDYYTGLIGYAQGTENSTSNSSGLDNYFEQTTLPAYAHSFLLTAVLSADYVDVTGDGPTSDDLGTYTKINYTRVDDGSGSSTASHFKWRTPFSKANHSEGLKEDGGGPIGDDKANYVYGEKEIWYVHSIESKNYVAFFTLSNRDDGFGVSTEDGGGINTSFPLQKLDQIDLYAKQDLLYDPTPAPLKTVHFEYDYSLCKGESVTNSSNNYSSNVSALAKIENNNTASSSDWGKLTLKKVYFTYQNSKKGKLSPYQFFYADNDHNGSDESNFKYNMKSYDRWGNYKPNRVSPSYDYSDWGGSNDISNGEFPYTDQATGLADNYSAAWNLTKVKLPSGGEIKVTYEADDYAYVQDKRAMQMFIVSGAGNVTNPSMSAITSNSLRSLYDVTPAVNNLNLYVTIDPALAAKVRAQSSAGGGSTANILRNLFLKDENGSDMDFLYFRFLLNIERFQGVYTPKYEYVQGYCRIDFSSTPCDFINLTDNVIYVSTQKVNLFDNKVVTTPINPISMCGINFTRMYLPHVAYDNQQDPSGFSLLDVFGALKSAFVPIIQFFEGGIANALRINLASSQFIPQRSFIRLFNPTFAKKGGGSRVQKMALNDGWSSVNTNLGTSYTDSEYGQEYSYKTLDNYGNEISSGVAAYEPLVGGDENPWRKPVFYKEEHILAPSDDYYLETPFGESFFPSPVVGYSRVQVKNLKHTNLTRHATGAVVHEFYTAKDFPTKVSHTQMKAERHKPFVLFKFLKTNVRDFMTTSQGYVVENNDMHGKDKAQFVYKEDQASTSSSGNYYGNGYISGIEYNYKHKSDRLDNKVDVINKDGSIQNTYVGVDYDMNVDMRQHRTIHIAGALHGNLEAFLLAIFPGLVPTIWPGLSIERTRYRSAVITKVINNYGLLEETVAHDLGSTVSTKNKLWDAETGEVLLTQTINNFDDNVYALTYPSHWSYDRMGGAYKNVGVVVPASVCTTANVTKYFVKADEVILNGTVKAWVTNVTTTPTPAISFVDITGATVTPNSGSFIRVLRSGRRNQQQLPVAKIVSLNNPVNSSGNALQINASTNVISASAAEFSDQWDIFCECGITSGGKYNPYIIGKQGNWRPMKSYVYLTGRNQDLKNENTDIRKDGPYSTFSPFWTPNTTTAPFDWNKSSDQSWQFTTQMTVYSPYGFELENKDALNRKSAAVYGYNNTLPVSVSSNASYNQIGFDGFEDYDFRPCQDDHFGFKLGYNTSTNNYVTQAGSVNQKFSHTGRRSIKLAVGATKSITKILENCSNGSTGNNTSPGSGGGDHGGGSGTSVGVGTKCNTCIPPAILFSSPSSNPFATNSQNITVSASIASPTTIQSVTVTNNGNTIPFTLSGTTVTINATLNLGSNAILVTATNLHGTSNATMNITYTP